MMVCSRVTLLILLLLIDFTVSYSPDLLSLRHKLGVQELTVIPSNSTIPLPPYLHPAMSSHVRVKRGGDNVVSPRGDKDIINAPKLQPNRQVQQETEEEKKECYFKHHRQTHYEKIDRPTVSTIKDSCSRDATLRRMSELIEVQYTNQYGSPHGLDLILKRGSGETIDWADRNKVEEVGRRWICKAHENELGSNWEKSHYRHFKTHEFPGGRVRDVCSMPDPFFQHRK
ncbi:hypothetical protein PENTCL1PPCAC_20804 [Pristionchus entomophagus]|uniref:Uncharacterized protein n=1 Tax=Pristionchus entomophagus TaxID=358040 RepID=A0AAV5TWJ5_9BILA|nr:hypothetical protein PENTCL1PPCAC_20804 [Pristionchus entomophagus]